MSKCSHTADNYFAWPCLKIERFLLETTEVPNSLPITI